ncbi:MAG: hypothetical protein HY850_03140 [Betaproteobacteria bacterium]|nr:hypothetical protein [Betaproteobacteria bacterium]
MAIEFSLKLVPSADFTVKELMAAAMKLFRITVLSPAPPSRLRFWDCVVLSTSRMSVVDPAENAQVPYVFVATPVVVASSAMALKFSLETAAFA